MTVTQFSTTPNTDGYYVGSITGVTETVNVDIERDKGGIIIIRQKASTATRYKSAQTLKYSKEVADFNFNIVQEAENATLDYQLLSTVPVTSFIAK